ncbi:MAG: ribonuclease HII [Candidatus Aphodousia sp.]|nr:ribonuclease HII [Sutterella sp.]MDY2899324.1 ribonuclease HII [Candidatus Aphodousia sp.]
MAIDSLDLFCASDYQLVAGVDEAGRGALAGPVVAAAVILDPKRPIEGLADSKQLSEAKREALAPIIRERALAWAIGSANVQEIAKLNILQATLLAMWRAVDALKQTPEFVQVDGNQLPKWPYICEAVVKGDSKIACISAASIIAKTARDAIMRDYAIRYPEYGFERHMGYGTAEHLKAIETCGVLPIHRTTFRPFSNRAK